MADHTKSSSERKDLSGDRARLEVGIWAQVRTWIEVIVEEELAAVLGAESSVRVDEARRGYRHGSRPRTLTTSLGPTTFTSPRARLGPLSKDAVSRLVGRLKEEVEQWRTRDPVASNRRVAGDVGGEGGRVRFFPIS